MLLFFSIFRRNPRQSPLFQMEIFALPRCADPPKSADQCLLLPTGLQLHKEAQDSFGIAKKSLASISWLKKCNYWKLGRKVTEKGTQKAQCLKKLKKKIKYDRDKFASCIGTTRKQSSRAVGVSSLSICCMC